MKFDGLDRIDRQAAREGQALLVAAGYRTRKPKRSRTSRGHGDYSDPAEAQTQKGARLDARAKRARTKRKDILALLREMSGG